jgi:hypothetical protein
MSGNSSAPLPISLGVKHNPSLKQLPTNPTSLLTPNRFLADIYAPFAISSPKKITVFFLKSP